MKKVDFVIAGTQKGGTTALDYYLRQHENIQMASTKEVHFFDLDSNFTKEVDYSNYHSFFETPKVNQITGEATPIYMYWYETPKRIWTYNSNMKWVIILRNPVERAYSAWNMSRTRCKDRLSFSEAIRLEESRRQEAMPLQHRQYSYVDRGFYTEQLRRIWHYFPREQTLIIKNEDIRERLIETLSEISRFLGISDFPDLVEEEVHAKEYINPLAVDDRLYLENIYYYDIKQLERLLGWDCSEWYSEKKSTSGIIRKVMSRLVL